MVRDRRSGDVPWPLAYRSAAVNVLTGALRNHRERLPAWSVHVARGRSCPDGDRLGLDLSALPGVLRGSRRPLPIRARGAGGALAASARARGVPRGAAGAPVRLLPVGRHQGADRRLSARTGRRALGGRDCRPSGESASSIAGSRRDGRPDRDARRRRCRMGRARPGWCGHRVGRSCTAGRALGGGAGCRPTGCRHRRAGGTDVGCPRELPRKRQRALLRRPIHTLQTRIAVPAAERLAARRDLAGRRFSPTRADACKRPSDRSRPAGCRRGDLVDRAPPAVHGRGLCRARTHWLRGLLRRRQRAVGGREDSRDRFARAIGCSARGRGAVVVAPAGWPTRFAGDRRWRRVVQRARLSRRDARSAPAAGGAAARRRSPSGEGTDVHQRVRILRRPALPARRRSGRAGRPPAGHPAAPRRRDS